MAANTYLLLLVLLLATVALDVADAQWGWGYPGFGYGGYGGYYPYGGYRYGGYLRPFYRRWIRPWFCRCGDGHGDDQCIESCDDITILIPIGMASNGLGYGNQFGYGSQLGYAQPYYSSAY